MDHKQNHQNPAADRIDTCIIGDMAQQDKLAPMAEVITLLKNCGHSFTDLAPIRERYEVQFGSDQTWSFPFHDGSHLGGVFLPVKEGVLYLPYDCVCSDCYEQFELKDAHLLDGAEARRLLDILETHYTSLSRALQKAAGLEAVANHLMSPAHLWPGWSRFWNKRPVISGCRHILSQNGFPSMTSAGI